MKNSFKEYIKRKLSPQNRRNTLTFAVFLAISTLFWFLMSLNDEVQREYELQVNITNLPEDITVLTPQGKMPVVNVSVRDKGSNHLSRKFIGNSNLRIEYNDIYNQNNNRFSIGETQLGAQLRQHFGSTATILSFSPDSLTIQYTTLPPVKVPVIIKSDISTNAQYTVSGPVHCSVDSVLLYYSSAQESEKPQALFTDKIILSELKDTTTVKAGIKVPAGCRAIPNEITVTIPIEPLVSKSFSVQVEPINAPTGMKIITFPTSVNFTCLVPMSLYNTAEFPLKAYADFDKRDDNTIKLEMSLIPDNYLNGALNPASVEYILESL